MSRLNRLLFVCWLQLLLIICLGVGTAAQAQSGPSDRELLGALQDDLSWAQVRSLKTFDRLEQAALGGTIFDGRFEARVQAKEPLYVAVEEFPEGTIVDISVPEGTRFTISGGFVSGRDAGLWEVQFKRLAYSPRLAGTRLTDRRFRRPVAKFGSSEAGQILARRDQRVADEAAKERRAAEERGRIQEERRAAEKARDEDRAARDKVNRENKEWVARTYQILEGTWSSQGPIKVGDPAKVLDYADHENAPQNACGGPHSLSVTLGHTEGSSRYNPKIKQYFGGEAASVWSDITPHPGTTVEDYTTRTGVRVSLDEKERRIFLKPDSGITASCAVPRSGASGGYRGVYMPIWESKTEVFLEENTLTSPPRSKKKYSVSNRSFVLVKD